MSTHHGDGSDVPLRLVSDPEDATRRNRACGRGTFESVHSTLMDRIEGLRSAFPLRLAQAYAPERVSPVRRSTPVRAVEQTFAVDRAELSAPSAVSRPANIDKLVAARVDTPISFPGDSLTPARSSAGAYLLQSQPADRNSAATAVNVGRMLDVTA